MRRKASGQIAQSYYNCRCKSQVSRFAEHRLPQYEESVSSTLYYSPKQYKC